MQIPTTFEQRVQPDGKGYLQYLSQVLIRFWAQLAKVVNNGIQMYNVSDGVSNKNIPKGTVTNGNVMGYWWQGDIPAPGNTVINHTLGYPPIGFITVRVTGVYLPYFVSSTPTTITISSNAPSPGSILFII